jgi:flagellar biosynthesis protein FlhF
MIKKFKAPTMWEAMKLAKDFFGDSAIVLQSKKIKEGGLYDLTKAEVVEITATSEQYLAEKTGSADIGSGPTVYSPASVRKVREVKAPNVNTPTNGSTEIKAELDQLKASLMELSESLRFKKMLLLPETTEFLVEQLGIEEELAAELVQRIFLKLQGADLKDKSRIHKALRLEMANYFKVSKGLEVHKGRPKVICLAGPTGMGKTTTIVKLATNPEFYGNRRVALITIDTYRVAAAAQLKTFAVLANLPLEIVYQPAELRTAMDKLKDYEVILIDTAGRSPHNKKHLDELKHFVEIAAPDEIHLVMSVSTRTDNVVAAAKKFGALPVNRLILTKIDETDRLGHVLNIAGKIDLPVSFLTNGQSVPDDILLADKHELATMITGEA